MSLPAAYRNRVLQRDVLEVLRELPAGSVDMIYGDPDYGVGIDYAGKKYNTRWDEYVEWYIELARLSLRALKPDGNLFFINYPRQNAHLRVKFLDDAARQTHDYVWVYNTNVGHSRRKFTNAHRSVLHATKSGDNRFYKAQVALPYQNPDDKRIKARVAQGHLGRMPYSWFYFDLVKNTSKDKTFHACQIPLALVEMLIKSCTVEGDDCFILFGGSGSEVVLCRDLARGFLSCELHEPYYRMIRARLARDDGEVDDAHKIARRSERGAAPAARVKLV